MDELKPGYARALCLASLDQFLAEENHTDERLYRMAQGAVEVMKCRPWYIAMIRALREFIENDARTQDDELDETAD